MPADMKKGWYHIGDSLLMDVAGADNQGARTIYINRELPENLRELTPETRLQSEAGRKFLSKMFQEEKNKYQFGDQQALVNPDFAIFSLLELKKILAEVDNISGKF